MGRLEGRLDGGLWDGRLEGREDGRREGAGRCRIRCASAKSGKPSPIIKTRMVMIDQFGNMELTSIFMGK